ncbi:PREDICTED: cysteine-rich receptor-like protein kinase 40 [Camelina sativa]|uniref:Cysteine-rich receptor-like protein kinase 40 n=1 Tax=Camelina sativa TaxID=90675 RepID=A0ABM1QRM1_CAMSA|nr:PREDICTED: cysteine-rich receptor-like protein kinase 40 [Camelina sativa]
MVKCPALMIYLSSFILFVLQTLHGVNSVKCFGSSYNRNGSYPKNRQKLFSDLADKVVANRGFYNASFGQYPDRVYALAMCARGYEQEACLKCVQTLTQDTISECQSRKDSFMWGGEQDVSCLVRSSSHSTFRSLKLSPPFVSPSQDIIEPSKTMTLFVPQWEAMVNRTLRAATKAKTSSILKYYSAGKAGFTNFQDVYMLMQCTPDITSEDCNTCLEGCVIYFRTQYLGREGGMASFPSCFFRWDIYAFHGAFDDITRVPAPPPGPHVQEKENSKTDKKCETNESEYCLTTFGGAEYSDSDGQFMLRFDLGMIIIATDDFSSENTLGQGGFGTVYKGTFPNGKEVAVKRLTKGSGQGDIEFKNEVSLLTRLQHRNLVKLLVFCNEGGEEILVYEFVPNASLDNFIFDEEKRSLLTWEVRFKIIEGIARGLLYLHENSHLKIIHRDLKLSNILLDAEMNPKVADFGTARLFDTDETRAETKRIAGTRGYMAPEYLNRGEISAKSDVYSFGVMLLEMISGEKNKSYEGEGLAAFTWKRWVEGKPEVIIDPLLIEHPRNEIIKLIKIGLLCVQENAAKRPTMSSVIIWLGSETILIPLPNAPAFTGSQSQSESGTTMSMSGDVFTELTCR